jgi:hypothetical protein
LRHGLGEESPGRPNGRGDSELQSYVKAADMKDEQGSQLEATNAVPTSRRRHWMVGIALAIPALPVLAALVLYLRNPAGTRMLVGGLLHPPIANTQPPAMFADQLTTGRADKAETSRQLTARLQHEFPIGTTEATLKEKLLAQGFKPLDLPQNCVQPVQNGQLLQADGQVAVCLPPSQGKSLKYEWSSGVCGNGFAGRPMRAT